VEKGERLRALAGGKVPCTCREGKTWVPTLWVVLQAVGLQIETVGCGFTTCWLPGEWVGGFAGDGRMEGRRERGLGDHPGRESEERESEGKRVGVSRNVKWSPRSGWAGSNLVGCRYRTLWLVMVDLWRVPSVRSPDFGVIENTTRWVRYPQLCGFFIFALLETSWFFGL
jgi:hypothetical protein